MVVEMEALGVTMLLLVLLMVEMARVVLSSLILLLYAGRHVHSSGE